MKGMSSATLSRVELMQSIREAASRTGARFILFHQAMAERLGLNLIDLRCLTLAQGEEDMTPGKFAELTGLTTGAITGVIDRLEKARLVKRERDPHDRRRVIVRLLPGRKAEIDALFAPLGKAMHQALEPYSDEQLALILDFFSNHQTCVAAAMDEFRQQPPKTGKRSNRPTARK
jgi:DNA-binding MarR family transcriptional regulator